MFSQAQIASQLKNSKALSAINELFQQIGPCENIHKDDYPKVHYALCEIIFHYIPVLTSRNHKTLPINKAEQYIREFLVFYPVNGLHTTLAWLLEVKLSICDKAQHQTMIDEIVDTYEAIFEKWPLTGNWFVRINYLNFCSKHLTPDECIPLAILYLEQAANYARLPTNKDLAKIKTILSIEYEKLGDYDQEMKYAYEAIKHDSTYAPGYSCVARHYAQQANICLETGRINAAHKNIALKERYYNIAMQLDVQRFNKNHPINLPSQSGVSLVTERPAINTAVCSPSSQQSVSLKGLAWPSLFNKSDEEMKKKFCAKYPMAKLNDITYSELDKAMANLLIAEEVNSVTIELINDFIAAAKKAGNEYLIETVKAEYEPLLSQKGKEKDVAGQDTLSKTYQRVFKLDAAAQSFAPQVGLKPWSSDFTPLSFR